jgi:adenylate cyclase
MPRIHLKAVLGKGGELTSVLTLLAEQLQSSFCITDDKGKVLLGTAPGGTPIEYPILAEDEQIGSVKGDAGAATIARVLNHAAAKEAEKKKLGSEVLNLYQEINLIFNFSEKLAQTIDAPSICDTTLNQARHVIRSDSGVIVLWDETKKNLQVLSSYGDSFFSEEKINQEISLLLRIILSGQSEIITDTTALREAGIILPEVRSLIYSALKVNHRIMGIVILASHEQIQYTAADLKLLTTLALQSSAAIESALLYEKNIREAKEREEAMRLVYEVTGKFVPYEFIGSLGHKLITDVKLGDQVEKIVTVLFSDIRNYTTLSEQMSPEENFRFVCSFNERMGPAIRKNKGFINQYLGDAIMAIFPGSASDALEAAIEMQREVALFNRARKENNQSPIQIGVGMHTGPLIMGITGDKDRMDATTISDTVNTASRLESLTKHYKVGIILSDASLVQINKDRFHLRYLGLVQLKGKHEPLHIHECFNCNPEAEIARKRSTLGLFNSGIEEYLNRSFQTAVTNFTSVKEIHPEDQTADFFLANAERYLHEGAPENWKGVVEMLTK